MARTPAEPLGSGGRLHEPQRFGFNFAVKACIRMFPSRTVHQLTGSVLPDAVGSILVGVLLAIVAVVLIDRNRRFLVGQEADSRVRAAVIRALQDDPEVSRVTYLRVEVVGPRMISIVGDVDLVGDDSESHLAVRLRALETRVKTSPAVAGVVLSLSAPDEPTLLD